MSTNLNSPFQFPQCRPPVSVVCDVCLSHLSGVCMSEVYLWEVGSALLSGPNEEFCSVVTEQPSMRKECGIFSQKKKNLTEFYKGLTPTDPELHSQIQKRLST